MANFVYSPSETAPEAAEIEAEKPLCTGLATALLVVILAAAAVIFVISMQWQEKNANLLDKKNVKWYNSIKFKLSRG